MGVRLCPVSHHHSFGIGIYNLLSERAVDAVYRNALPQLSGTYRPSRTRSIPGLPSDLGDLESETVTRYLRSGQGTSGSSVYSLTTTR